MSQESDNNDGEKQPSATTSTKSLGSLLKRFLSFRDNSRIERLRQCEVLKDILQECRAQQPNRRQLEHVGVGIRSVRHFDWRDVQPEDSCVREEFALWSCRAICMKCGFYSGELKYCLDEREGDKRKLLDKKITFFEPTSDEVFAEADVPCKALQRTVGDCVRKNTLALEESIKKRKLESQTE
ncbi:hypothetical protein ACA910_005123 [Epithemia clementina (nom. ined.)]